MKMTAVLAMKKIASEKFKLKDVTFDGFDSIDLKDIGDSITDSELEDLDTQIEAWAKLRIAYEGEPPENYRVLNSIIMDWVDDHDENLKKTINPELKAFLHDQYKNIDISHLDENFDDYIWEDQVDYMAEIDENNKEIKFVVELVLEVEETEDSE